MPNSSSAVSHVTRMNLLHVAISAGLPSRRWIYEQLFAHDAPLRPECEIVEDGVLEVDGPPPDGRESWRRGELCGDIEHLGGHRRVILLDLARTTWRRRERQAPRVAQTRTAERPCLRPPALSW